MRIGDLDALKSKAVKMFGFGENKYVPLKVIQQAPTIDAVPVVYGRWKKSGNEKICSACKFIYYSNNDDFNYCPNCGARMGGE